MKKRILSLVLCAAMLLSMCLFMGAGVVDDASDAPAESTEVAEAANVVSFTNAGPLVKAEPQTVGPAKARALAANAAGATDNGVQLSKTVTPNEDGTSYTVRLDAYATGEQTTSISTTPCDIVLVLDVSGSMDYCITCGNTNIDRYSTHTVYVATTSISTNNHYYIKSGSTYDEIAYCDGQHLTGKCAGGPGWYKCKWISTINDHTAATKIDPNGTQFYEKRTEACSSRLSALKTAVNNFIDQVAAKETDTVKHNISIVKFASGSTNTIGNNFDRDGYNYSQVVKDLTDAKTGKDALKSTVNSLTAAGATSADYGMQHAAAVLKGDSSRGLTGARADSNKVVVMFTDGEPNHQNGFDNGVANAAISASKGIKDTGATVYTIGCFSGADGTPVNSFNGVTNVNKYMHLVSSNYKNAQSMTNTGAATYPEGGKSYYLSAASADDLSNIFKTISQQIGGAGNETLTSQSVLKDAVTPYFDLPSDVSAITLKTADCTGVDANGKLTFGSETDAPAGVIARIDEQTVSVTGFDYSANWCGSHSGTYSGKKLIVEFTITPTENFLGGENVQTNVGENDGIYAPGAETPVEKFEPQYVDVKVKQIQPADAEKTIYLGETAKLSEMVTVDSRLNGVNNAYVTTTYTIKNGDTVLGTYTVAPGETSGTWSGSTEVQPEKMHSYTVTCDVTSANSKYYEQASGTLTVYVNTCSLTISKTVDGKDNGQSFVFTVKDANGNVITTVAVKGGASKTITGLPIGTYTVTEDTQWSWQYDLTSGNDVTKELKANAAEDHAAADFTNTYKGTNWLTSIAEAINIWIRGSVERN